MALEGFRRSVRLLLEDWRRIGGRFGPFSERSERTGLGTGPDLLHRVAQGGGRPEPNPAQILWEGFLGKDGEGQRRRSVAVLEACRSVGANGERRLEGAGLGKSVPPDPDTTHGTGIFIGPRHDPWDWHICRSIDPPGTTPGLIGIYGIYIPISVWVLVVDGGSLKRGPIGQYASPISRPCLGYMTRSIEIPEAAF